MNKVSINTVWCMQCGICVEFCPAKVFVQELGKTPIPANVEKCTGCKLCMLRCPDFAITVEVKKDGK